MEISVAALFIWFCKSFAAAADLVISMDMYSIKTAIASGRTRKCRTFSSYCSKCVAYWINGVKFCSNGVRS
eukprot:XP_001709290.1 Hypothetical protein GL50803_101484 [Giardia lamblia ATCC 50803]